jgi:exonuclease SbcC
VNPLYLSLSGFLSYRDPVDLDFTGIEVTCITGANGAGKSSLLDAITWALFGQARKRDDSLIHSQAAAAEVTLVFSYEGNIFRVQRVKPREKTALLEFHILQDTTLDADSPAFIAQLLSSKSWRPLTERSMRETEQRIQQTLRMDYETFTNASFFLQGKADQFTQQRPGDRKRILGSILGLEAWDAYRQNAADRRRLVETDAGALDGRLQEIAAELAQEPARLERLGRLTAELAELSELRKTQETLLANIRQVAASLAEQEKLVDALLRQAESALRRKIELEMRSSERIRERGALADLLEREAQIRADYAAWQAARQGLERWEQIAGQFRQQEKRREAPRLEIQAARARLEQEFVSLQQQQAAAQAARQAAGALLAQLEPARQAQADLEARLGKRGELDRALQLARQNQADGRAENQRLRSEMDDLKLRIDRLNVYEGADCPFCGQALSPQERKALVERLTLQGKEMGDRFRANLILAKTLEEQVGELESQLAALAVMDAELRSNTQTVAQLHSRHETLLSQLADWESGGALRLVEVGQTLEQENYALEARRQLAEIDAGLKEIGYDAQAHDAARQAEQDGRSSEVDLRALERAQAALVPLESEIANLQTQIAAQQNEAARQQAEYEQAAQALEATRTQAPDLYESERRLYDMQERENRTRLELGAARQEVLVLDDLKTRRQALDAQRQELARQIMHYKLLERAFGKDGVPALLIEQALPEIEAKANEVLDRLSAGAMSVRFVTQAAYKDNKRSDLRETLDIQISDSAGIRDYELFSGGEAFRVNFAIRLALSEVLTQRAGARLQTLVIDEGFGSQDAQGRQRLVEAINLVRGDFSRILVITHIDELKDAFSTRIEVEKGERGSTLKVI